MLMVNQTFSRLTKANSTKETAFQSLFNNLEDHVKTLANIERLLVKTAHFHLYHFYLRHAVYWAHVK